uniref:Type I restriction enzyme, R subunit n=1 Tax=Candidatus Kentrum sp. DK TaxID=2126562 RepID=A0A450T189_9GAMM|nr:MAG: type I restriction enzyme, R subunit [Candidatus Kentron sp. DK]
MTNQNPEQRARDAIDAKLIEAGWVVQSKRQVDLAAGKGVAIREYQTDIGPADYVLFVDSKPVGVIEAKRAEEGERMTVHEDQARYYATATLKYNLNDAPLPFVYESTSEITWFTDQRDPKPRSREVFSFHRPETLAEWFGQKQTLRARLQNIPALDPIGLRPAQIAAITNLEKSFRDNCPKSLIQMATGAGKTFTACTFVYRLLKHADAKRILFLVDTRNLGEQAEGAFRKFQPVDDNRKFTELYNVQRLNSGYIASDAQVCISTIQRLYAILKGEELDESSEEQNPNESGWQWREKSPLPVVYSADNPMDQFDFVIIDECHRSIYNLWRQVLDYYDAFLIGLTATPDQRTFGFFNQNVVSEYPFEESVTDGVNVPYDVFTIETEITRTGGKIEAKETVERREKLSRRRRWERLDEDFAYTPNKLDRDVVNPSQIREILRAFRDKLPVIFPDRHDEKGEFEVPKTLIFAKSDSHADDIIRIAREEFGEDNEFCKKITYRTSEDPKTVLKRFRNEWAPRIAVTVDMIATGTDVKPLEVLLFLRDVKSVNYFEQMKGRGARTIGLDDLRKVSRTARHTKTHFVIVDAVGATKSKKTDSRPLERKPGVPLKNLLEAVAMGARDEDLFTSLANRLVRLDKKFTDDEKGQLEKLTGGQGLLDLARGLLDAYDPDRIIDAIPESERTPAKEEKLRQQTREQLTRDAATPFTGRLGQFIENVRKVHEQIIDDVNIDTLERAEWDQDAVENARQLVREFADYLEEHRDEITALSIFYGQPYRRRELTLAMVKELLDTLKRDKPQLAPHTVWQAYQQLETEKQQSPKSELVALVSLVRRISGIDEALTPYDRTVDRNFKNWIFRRHSGAGEKFNEQQMAWLHRIKEHIAGSFHMTVEDLDYTPFDAQGGVGGMYDRFGDGMEEIIEEMNEALAA